MPENVRFFYHIDVSTITKSSLWYMFGCTIVCTVQKKYRRNWNWKQTIRKDIETVCVRGGGWIVCNVTAQMSKIITTISPIVDDYLPCYYARRHIPSFASFPSSTSIFFHFLVFLGAFCPSFFCQSSENEWFNKVYRQWYKVTNLKKMKIKPHKRYQGT